MSNNKEREVIEVQRRRKRSKPQGRAQAPRRRSSGSSSQSGGMRPVDQPPSGGSFNMPSRGKLGGSCGTILILILFIGFYLLSGGEGLGTLPESDPGYDDLPPLSEPLAEQSTPQIGFTPPPSADTGNTWLVMLYQDADDQVLEKDILIDLNEAERIGSSENVHIVAQIDRFRGGYAGDGNWVSGRRYYVTQDSDLERINSQFVQDLGEVDMGSGDTLVDFIHWATSNFPADRYVLILSDHGMGWPGGWSDPAPGGSDGSQTPLASRLGQNMYLNELDHALGTALQLSGIGKLDLIGMDACLMSQLEVYTALHPHAHYAVASEEVEPGLGWAYAGFLGALTENPGMSTADLGKLIVQSYIDDDQRIVDPQARAEFLRGGSPLGGFFGAPSVSAEQIASQLEHNITLSAVNLDQLPNLMDGFNALVYEMQNENQALVAQARSYAQSYTSIFGRQVPPSFIDLGHFAALLRHNTKNNDVANASEYLLSQINQFVVAERHGSGKPGSTGVAIYFPNSAMYNSPITGPQSYTAIANRFAETSLWDDYLAFHYNNRTFSAQDTIPVQPSGGITRAPGQGQISVSPIKASSDSAAPGESVRLEIDINGQNIGYIYLFTGYYDQGSNSIYVADMDYLESSDVRDLNGVYYPVWSENADFTLAFNWEPIVFAVSDGDTSIPALFTPESFGRYYDETVYTVNGIFKFSETNQEINAQLYFQNQSLIAVYGFTGGDEVGAPHEITPQPGDQFTVLGKWLDLTSDGGIKEVVYERGETLIFGSQPFTWQELYAAPGEYIVGFIIEDFDGVQYPVYTQLTVR
ncbi:MAG: clostripain-related cysteine peptidase [Chloroflexota bacterium]